MVVKENRLNWANLVHSIFLGRACRSSGFSESLKLVVIENMMVIVGLDAANIYFSNAGNFNSCILLSYTLHENNLKGVWQLHSDSSSLKISAILVFESSSSNLAKIVVTSSLGSLFPSEDPDHSRKKSFKSFFKLLDHPQAEMKSILENNWDTNCMIFDEDLGKEYHGWQGCLTYVNRMRSVFKNIQVHLTSPPQKQTDSWTVSFKMTAVYHGIFSMDHPSSCTLTPTVNIQFRASSALVTFIKIQWNAQNLIPQLDEHFKLIID